MSVIPVLDTRRDAMSCDWVDADYQCELIQLNGGKSVKVSHRITGADALLDLVLSGSAKFAVEITSPSTFRSFLELAQAGETSHTFHLGNDDDKSDAQARPGLIAVRSFVLPVDHLSSVWRTQSNGITVSTGQWLARAQHANLLSPEDGLLSFVPDNSVQRCQLRCEYADPAYKVRINPDDLAKCVSDPSQPAARAIVLAAYTAALADADKQVQFTGGEEGDKQKSGFGVQLEAHLKERDPSCPTPGEDGFDPLRAATLLAGSDLIRFEEGNA